MSEKNLAKATLQLPCSVVIVSAKADNRQSAMTATAMYVSQVPPLLVVSISKTFATYVLIEKSKEFAINVIADTQLDLSKKFGSVHGYEVDKFQEHPVCWLFDPEHDRRPPQNEVVRQLYQCLLDYEPQLQSFGIPTDGCYFFVVVPFEGVIYAFIFAKRNKELLSRTDPKKSSAISELCREFMLRTCTEIVCELCDVRYRQEHEQ